MVKNSTGKTITEHAIDTIDTINDETLQQTYFPQEEIVTSTANLFQDTDVPMYILQSELHALHEPSQFTEPKH